MVRKRKKRKRNKKVRKERRECTVYIFKNGYLID
jgi:hypothetical protein